MIASAADRRDGRDPRTRCDPLIVGLELEAELIVEDAQVAVAPAHDCLRHDGLHLLRHHADIGLVAAVVAEAIEAEAVVEMAEQRDVVLQGNIGPPTAAAAKTAAASPEAAATAAESTAAAAEAAAATGEPACAAHAPKTLAAASGMRAGGTAAAGAGKGGVTPRPPTGRAAGRPGAGTIAPAPACVAASTTAIA